MEAECTSCSPQNLISWNQTIPYDFSPNNDGIADTFFVENINNATYFEIECWDRWGNMVHNEVGFNPNGFQNHTIQWDGRTDNNGQFLQSPNTVFMVITLGNCNSEIQFQRSVSYCRVPACDLGPHDTVPNYVPPLFGLETPPTHYRNLDLYGGIYHGNHHWYACDTIFVGGANSRRTPYFIAGSTSQLGMTATNAIEIRQGDDVDFHPGADVDMLPGPVNCCPELRLANPDPPSEPKEKATELLQTQSDWGGRITDANAFIPASKESNTTGLAMTAAPNPASGLVTLALQLPADASVHLAIYDIHMREISEVLAGVALPAGPHQRVVVLDGLPSGIYFARLKAGNDQITLKIIRN